MRVLAIDPGTEESAYVMWESGSHLGGPPMVLKHGKVSNRTALSLVGDNPSALLVVEMIASYGMPVGAEVFETCVWIGRFLQEHGGDSDRLFRRDIKIHLCGQPRAKDANIRQALIDRFGGKAKAVGTKKKPGPLYAIKGDEWAALAVAITYTDLKGKACDSAKQSE